MSSQIALKNLQGLNDVLDAEKLCYEKLCVYHSLAKDANLKKLIATMQQSTKTHYDTVYNYLKSHQQS